MSANPNWEFAGAGPDGASFKIDGIDVWKHQWVDTGERAQVKDPHHHRDFTFDVYEIQSGGQTVKFAAGEFSNCIWGFYVRKSLENSQNLGGSPVFSAFDLKAGHLYRVKASFIDHEGGVHPVGESWRYESHAFIPYHAGLSLNVTDATGARQIFLQDYPEAQGKIVAHFSDYVEESGPPREVAMEAPPLLPAPPNSSMEFTRNGVRKGVMIGGAVTVFMSLGSWMGISGYGDEPNAFQAVMTLLNLPSIFIAFGEKGRPGGYYALGFLIVLQWAVVGSMVGLVVARNKKRSGDGKLP